MYEASNLALSTTSEISDGHTDKKKKHKCNVSSNLLGSTDEKSRKCDVCFKVFKTKYLRRHKKTHTDVRSHKCDVCSMLFRAKDNLQKHKKTHNDEKPYKCDLCAKLFKRKYSLLQHKYVHTNEKNYKCVICLKLFRSKSSLWYHKLTHTDTKNRCDICSRLFKTKYSLLQHKRRHTDERKKQVKSYQCFECGKNFTSKKDIIKHLQLHKKFPFKCDKCKKVFISKVQLENHCKVHIEEKLFSFFVEKRKLKSHILIEHIHNDSESVVSLQPHNNSVSLNEIKSECCEESGMKSCNVVLERLQIENNVVYDIKTINLSEPMDDVVVKLEPTDSSESKPFNEEEDVEYGPSITNGYEISSAIDEIKVEYQIIKFENYDEFNSSSL